jgi:hypothetical protein
LTCRVWIAVAIPWATWTRIVAAKVHLPVCSSPITRPSLQQLKFVVHSIKLSLNLLQLFHHSRFCFFALLNLLLRFFHFLHRLIKDPHMFNRLLFKLWSQCLKLSHVRFYTTISNR